MVRTVRLIGALWCVALVACSTAPSEPSSTSYQNAAFRYNGASYAGYGVSLSPFGVVSVRVSETATAEISAYGKGQTLQVNVDGIKTGAVRLRDCSCLTGVMLARP